MNATQWKQWVGFVLLLILSAGCVSIPEGSPAMKQQALSFNPPPGKAGVYVIRSFSLIDDGLTRYLVDLDYQEFGALGIDSYLFGLVPPGDHTLRNIIDHRNCSVAVAFTAEAGKNYFFRAKLGWWDFQIVPLTETDGKTYVQKFKLSGDNRFEQHNPTDQNNNDAPMVK